METSANVPRSLILSTRLYQALLAVYPSEFRRDYGGPMSQVFRDSGLRALREAGAAGLLSLWGRTMLDTVRTAIEEHSQRGVDMSKETFIKLSGWALMLGGLCILFGGLAASRPEYNRFNALSLPIDQYANVVAFPLLAIGLLLLSVGLIGLFLRYGQAMGSFGRFGLGLGAISGVIAPVGAIGMTVDDSLFWWIFFYGIALQFLGLALFGIASLRQKTLPRWNGLPILAGIWIPLYVLVGTISDLAGGRWFELPEAGNLIIILLTMAGLVGLGYLLQSDSQPAGARAAAV